MNGKVSWNVKKLRDSRFNWSNDDFHIDNSSLFIQFPSKNNLQLRNSSGTRAKGGIDSTYVEISEFPPVVNWQSFQFQLKSYWIARTSENGKREKILYKVKCLVTLYHVALPRKRYCQSIADGMLSLRGFVVFKIVIGCRVIKVSSTSSFCKDFRGTKSSENWIYEDRLTGNHKRRDKLF